MGEGGGCFFPLPHHNNPPLFRPIRTGRGIFFLPRLKRLWLCHLWHFVCLWLPLLRHHRQEGREKRKFDTLFYFFFSFLLFFSLTLLCFLSFFFSIWMGALPQETGPQKNKKKKNTITHTTTQHTYTHPLSHTHTLWYLHTHTDNSKTIVT